jgi:hypothetical protein
VPRGDLVGPVVHRASSLRDGSERAPGERYDDRHDDRPDEGRAERDLPMDGRLESPHTGADWPLTESSEARTMRAMTRDLLVEVLGRIPGVEIHDKEFTIADGHHVHFYLGQPGQAMVVRDIENGTLDGAFLTFTTRDKSASFYTEYGAVHAIATVPAKKEGRAGFA